MYKEAFVAVAASNTETADGAYAYALATRCVKGKQQL